MSTHPLPPFLFRVTSSSSVVNLVDVPTSISGVLEGDYELWLGEEAPGHKAWLRRLALAALQCLEPRSAWRTALERICQLQVSSPLSLQVDA